MKICIITPPVIDPSMPWLSIYQLKAYLEKFLPDQIVDAYDLNILFFNSIIKNPYINFQDSDVFSSYRKILENEEKINYALENWSLKNGIGLTRQSLVFEFNHNDSNEVGEFIEQDSLFSKSLEELLISNIDLINYKIISFSITCYEQLICALLMSRVIKNYNKEIKIVIGGNVVSRILKNLFLIKNIYSYIDYIIEKEGELPFANLILHIENKLIKKPTNCLIKTINQQTIDATYHPEIIEMSSIPTSNFSGIRTNLYFSPTPVFPISFTRGCSWARCTFCGIHSNWCSGYRVRPITNIVDEIEYIIKTYNTNLFRLVDESPSAFDILSLAKEIIVRGLEIRVEAYANISKILISEDYAKVLYDAGFRQFFFGLESIDKIILQSVKKEINNPDNYISILNNLNKQGISNYGFFMIGLPNDNDENERKLEEFIISTKSLNTIAVSSFLPVTNSEMVNDLSFSSKYKIEYSIRGNLTTRCEYKINGESVEEKVNERIENMMKRIFFQRPDLYVTSNLPYEARFYLCVKFGNKFSETIICNTEFDQSSYKLSNELSGRARGLS